MANRPRELVPLALAAATCSLLFAGLFHLTVRTTSGRRVSDSSLRGALSTSPALRGTDAVLDVVSTASLLGAIAVVALIALLRLARVLGLAAIGVVVAPNLLALLLKDHLLSRPDLGLDEVAPATLNSFPSGHATAAFSAVAALLLVLPRRWRLATATLGAAYAAATGVATMSAGWHRAGDSMGAFLLVGACAVVAVAVVVGLDSPAPQVGGAAPAPVPLRWFGAACGGCLLLGLPIAVTLARTSTLGETSLGAWGAFLAAALLVTGTVLGVLVALLWALDRMDSANGPATGPAPSPT